MDEKNNEWKAKKKYKITSAAALALFLASSEVSRPIQT